MIDPQSLGRLIGALGPEPQHIERRVLVRDEDLRALVEHVKLVEHRLALLESKLDPELSDPDDNPPGRTQR